MSSDARDDFSQKTKDLLAKRVGLRCSNPDCRMLTNAASTITDGYINIGVAAHITAASKKGPRYDDNMTSEERKSFDNGIWLCQKCAKLIDSDEKRYTIEILRAWKNLSEQAALLCLEKNNENDNCSDLEAIKFYAKCFDRAAFKDSIYREIVMDDFDRAIEDTIIALNTGVLRIKDGGIIQGGKSKSEIINDVWREKLEYITDSLRAIRRRLDFAKKEKLYKKEKVNKTEYLYRFYKGFGEWFDEIRMDILEVFSSICNDAGIPNPKIHLSDEYFRIKYRRF